MLIRKRPIGEVASDNILHNFDSDKVIARALDTNCPSP
jgi:hypothetical protein